MAWIELHEDLRNHPKLLRLARRLKVVDHDCVRSKLENLWLWCVSNRPDGNLAELTPAQIADAAGWIPDPASAFLKARGETWWLDADPLRVHDWDTYAGRFNDFRAKNRARKAAQRARQKAAVTGDSHETGHRDSHVTSRDCPMATVPDLTVPTASTDPPGLGTPLVDALPDRSPAERKIPSAPRTPAGFPALAQVAEHKRGWRAILEWLDEHPDLVNPGHFSTWLKPTRYAGSWGGTCFVEAPNQVFKDWLRTNYTETIGKARSALGLTFKIGFRVPHP